MDTKVGRKLTEFIVYLRKEVDPDFAIQQLACFLLVCSEQGITQDRISQILQMPQPSTSRNLKRLGLYIDEKKRVKGYDLIRQEPDMYERRKLACYLTKRGERVYRDIVHILIKE